MKKFKTTLLLVCISIFLITGSAFSAGEYFRSINSGDWNSNSTWEMSTNSGSTWIAAIITPDNTSGVITVQSPNIVTVTSNVSVDQLIIKNGAEISINTGILFTILDGSGYDMLMEIGSTLSGAGTVRTQGAGISMNIDASSFFNADLLVNSGFATVTDYSSPYKGRIYGDITIDNGATLSAGPSGTYSLEAYGTVLNNGILTGTSSKFVLFGPSLENNNSMTVSYFNMDTTSTISGTGTFTNYQVEININGNVTILNDITFSPTTNFNINNGGIFNLNSNTFTQNSGTLVMNNESSIPNSGTYRTQNSVTFNLRQGSNFGAPLVVNTGTTLATEFSSPYDGKLFGNVTIDNGATLSAGVSSAYSLEVFGTVTNNGKIAGNSSKFILSGSSLVNNDSMTVSYFDMDTTSNISGAGKFLNYQIQINGSGNITLLSNITVSPITNFNINSGGTLNPNSNTITQNSGTLVLFSGGTILNSGLFMTQGTVSLNLRNGSSFNAPLKVNTGTTTATEISSPYRGRLFGNVTVDNGAVLNCGVSSAYSLEVYGTVTNNGTISGNNSLFELRGSSLINNSAVTTSYMKFNSNLSLSGAGTYTCYKITIDTSAVVTLQNNVTVSPLNSFDILNGGILNPNFRFFTYTNGTFTVFSGGIIQNSGIFRTQGTVSLNLRNGSAFNAPLRVASGTTTANELSSPYIGRIYGTVTVNSGAVLKTGLSSAYSLEVYNDVTNNGEISGSTAADFIFAGTTQAFSGSGYCLVDVQILSGATVTMGSNHALRYADIKAGGTFDISNYKISFTASNPILQNGTFITANSDIEYNGTTLQQISTPNINYVGLKINNPAGVFLPDDIVVSDTLAVIQGDLNLSGDNITFTPDAYLTETPGNLIYGTTGYIITTRTLGAPSALNVAGFGAVLTTATSLGSTEIKRGHTVQTGLNGGTSIKRYYDITPTTNTGLNATLVYNFDPSELNGKPETSLQLFKSTNSGISWLLQGGTLNYSAKNITLTGLPSFSRWSADSSGVSASISMIMEAFYNSVSNRLNMSDTVRGYMRNTTTPYTVVDSAIGIVDYLTLKTALKFPTLPSGLYYLQMNHRNTIETWSKTLVSYTDGTTLNYDFTFAANMAFGDNQIQVDASPLRFGFYSGDVNQDGIIDVTDGGLVDNDAFNFVSGYVPTDVNGDDVTDLADAVFVDNNGFNFIGKITP